MCDCVAIGCGAKHEVPLGAAEMLPAMNMMQDPAVVDGKVLMWLAVPSSRVRKHESGDGGWYNGNGEEVNAKRDQTRTLRRDCDARPTARIPSMVNARYVSQPRLQQIS
jgi:hypothetical protein